MSQSLAIPVVITRVFSIPQLVFTNSIMTTHVNKIVDRPLMSSMAVGRYKSLDVMHPKGGYRKPIAITAPILDHKDGHYFKPNKVALKYPDLKKDVDLNAHVRMFNFVVKQMQRLLKSISSMRLAIC